MEPLSSTGRTLMRKVAALQLAAWDRPDLDLPTIDERAKRISERLCQVPPTPA